MRSQLLGRLENLRNSFWFLPSLMAAGAVALSFGAGALDDRLTHDWLKGVNWLYSGGADGARAVLQTIAGSMITIAGTVFSLTLVALSIASSQFGSRLLRNFMRDSVNQTVLGTFIATFLYCLLVLRTIRSEAEGSFVPHLSVTLGVLLALASLWMLIYFIHHVAVSIQADDIVARVSADLDQAMDRLFPEADAENDSRAAAGHADEQGTAAPVGLPEGLLRGGWSITAADDGYLQSIDLELLMRLAKDNDLVFRLDRRPGHYLVAGTTVVTVWPPVALDASLSNQVQQAFLIDDERTVSQDAEFGILQLVEIAVRALSPGINDPFTAISCADRLGSALTRLAQRPMPSGYRRDADGRVRVITVAVTFVGMVDAAFNQLRQYSRGNADVTIRLLETIAVVAAAARQPQDREALRRQAVMISQGAEEALPEEQDRGAVKLRFDAVRLALDASRECPEQLEQSEQCEYSDPSKEKGTK